MKASCSNGESSEGRAECTDCHENSLGRVRLAVVAAKRGTSTTLEHFVAERLALHVILFEKIAVDRQVLDALDGLVTLLDVLRPSDLRLFVISDVLRVSCYGHSQVFAEPAALGYRVVVLLTLLVSAACVSIGPFLQELNLTLLAQIFEGRPSSDLILGLKLLLRVGRCVEGGHGSQRDHGAATPESLFPDGVHAAQTVGVLGSVQVELSIASHQLDLVVFDGRSSIISVDCDRWDEEHTKGGILVLLVSLLCPGRREAHSVLDALALN